MDFGRLLKSFITPDANVPQQEGLPPDAQTAMEIMEQFGALVNGSNIQDDPLALACLGDFREGGSLRRDDRLDKAGKAYAYRPRIPTHQPAYAAMLNNLHKTMRSTLGHRLSIELDESALKPETQGLIEDYRRTRRDYQNAAETVLLTDIDKAGKTVRGNGIIEGFTNTISSADLYYKLHEELRRNEKTEDIIKHSSWLVEQLEKSELADPHTTIPVRIDGATYRLNNAMDGKTDTLGTMLFAYHEGRHHLQDITKVPPPLAQYLARQTGVGEEIPHKMGNAFRNDVTLKERYHTILSECGRAMKHSIEEGAHALQMVNLLSERHVLASKGEAAANLLRIVDMPTYPLTLDSPQELAVVLDTMAKGLPQKYAETFQILSPEFHKLPARDEFVSQAISALEGAADEARNPELYRIQLDLVKEYLESPRRFIAGSSPEHLRSR